MSTLPVDELNTQATPLDLAPETQVYHLPDWHKLSHPERLGVIRTIAESRGRDPRIARLAVDIIRTKAKPREYQKQAAALLKWVQDPKNFYYINEPGERLQDPIYTLQVKHGDCDDSAALLAALLESLRIPWKLVLSGRDLRTKQKVRYIEGDKVPHGVSWTHIYLIVGAPAFTPTEWWFAEPTIQGVPLGWDVISGDTKYLPEMNVHRGPTRVNPAPPAPFWYRPPVVVSPSPALAFALGAVDVSDVIAEEYGQGYAPLVGGLAAAESVDGTSTTFKRILLGVVTGVGVAVGTQLALTGLATLFPALRRGDR